MNAIADVEDTMNARLKEKCGMLLARESFLRQWLCGCDGLADCWPIVD